MYCNNTVGTENLTVKNFVNNGDDVSESNAGSLIVKGVLTAGNPIKKLSLENGATVKATGVDVPQVVANAFTATGTINIDASNITVDQWRELDEFPVMTVPVASNLTGVEWDVIKSFYRGVSTRWVNDEGGETKTLYVRKSPGFIVIVR